MTATTVIHPSAVISPEAELDSGVRVGPFSIIGPHVQIGKYSQIGSHVVIEGQTRGAVVPAIRSRKTSETLGVLNELGSSHKSLFIRLNLKAGS